MALVIVLRVPVRSGGDAPSWAAYQAGAGRGKRRSKGEGISPGPPRVWMWKCSEQSAVGGGADGGDITGVEAAAPDADDAGADEDEGAGEQEGEADLLAAEANAE